jgi:hypothetical protein
LAKNFSSTCCSEGAEVCSTCSTFFVDDLGVFLVLGLGLEVVVDRCVFLSEPRRGLLCERYPIIISHAIGKKRADISFLSTHKFANVFKPSKSI